MKKIQFIFSFFALLFLASCSEDDASLGEIVSPSNVQITAEIVGQDTDNPHGDGSGFVNFVATADNVTTYQFDFGDGTSKVSPTGVISKQYSQAGTNVYTVVVNAIGTGGIATSATMDVEVYSSFSDVAAENMLAGEFSGDSKTWYWAANQPLHVGLGPVEDDYGNGEFAYEAWWGGISLFDEEKYCMYSDKFVFSRTDSGITFEQTEGPAFIPGAYAGVLSVDGDVCHDETVVPSMYGQKNVTLFPSSSKAALEGSYAEQPYRGTSFEISDGGFMGWYVGSSTYDIISITDTEMRVRIIQDGGGFAWYALYQTQDPFEVTDEEQFDELVWADEFETDGAPNPENWTYDLGGGGWGNGEEQVYTDSQDNVVVADGVLKITAKADGNGGYTSGRIKTQDLFEFTYGRVEMRAKLPEAQGTWPALWMLGANFPVVGWPNCGEIDIMEQTGANKEEVLGTTHWFNTDSYTHASSGESTPVVNAATEFHTYELEWSDSAISISVDGTQYFELDNHENLPFHSDFFMIMNVAMGGTLGGAIDGDFTEDSMEIDYVRVYQ